MTRFADQLFDDLMREHGPALTHMSVTAAQKRHRSTRPVLLTAGVGGVAVAATVGTLVAGGATPAYAVTTHSDGTVTLAVYKQSGIAGVNSQLHRLGDDRVVVVPIGANCPSITSLPAPAVQGKQVSLQASTSGDGSVTVDAHGIPAGDILVLGWTASGRGQFSMNGSMTAISGHMSASGKVSAGGPEKARPGAWSAGSAAKLTSGPAPRCLSVPPPPARGSRGSGSSGASGGSGTSVHSGSGESTDTSS